MQWEVVTDLTIPRDGKGRPRKWPLPELAIGETKKLELPSAYLAQCAAKSFTSYWKFHGIEGYSAMARGTTCYATRSAHND